MILIDAGPLVALLDVDDPRHGDCFGVARNLAMAPLATTWPCFTEAMYLLGKAGGMRYQSALWKLRSAGRLRLLDLTDEEVAWAAELMLRYSDVPMDLADASLLAVAECRSIGRIFSLDRDFFIYRLRDGSSVDVIR